MAFAAILFGFLIPLLVIFFSGLNLFCMLSATLGIVSGLWWRHRVGKSGVARFGQRLCVYIGIASALLYLAAFIGFVLAPVIYERFELAIKAKTFSGSSNNLKATAVVPTLDSMLPNSKNVIWCSSFQLAWNELRDNIVKQPVQVVGAEDLANRLNTASQSSRDIEAKSFYAAAGLVTDGIVRRIRSEMISRFPSEPQPDFQNAADRDIVAYAFLAANVKFENPFEQFDGDFKFTDSKGETNNVAAFGIWDDDAPNYKKIIEQVEILYCSFGEDVNEDSVKYGNVDEFAIDLCKHTQPYQIVIAVVKPKETLAAMIADLEGNISKFRTSENVRIRQKFGSTDKLIVPEMFWEIAHHFVDLEGRTLGNHGFEDSSIKEALETIQFKLDRSGAVIKSEAQILVALASMRTQHRRFMCDKPFLIYVKKRDAEHPFFVMWVDNVELLTKK
jgi:hypothetical protein